MNGIFDRRFIDEHGLKVVYQGQQSEVVVAVKPGALNASPGNPCYAASR